VSNIGSPLARGNRDRAGDKLLLSWRRVEHELSEIFESVSGAQVRRINGDAVAAFPCAEADTCGGRTLNLTELARVLHQRLLEP
jgi:hypothetical protein